MKNVTRAFALLVAIASTIVAAACTRSTSAKGIWETGTVTLLVSAGPEVAEVVFADNALVRVDYTTADAAVNERVRARVDALVTEAKVKGLFIKWHEPGSSPQDEGALVGASPKPGQPNFARAMYHHLGDTPGFAVRAK